MTDAATIEAIFDAPKPLDILLNELFAVLEITQNDFADAGDIPRSSVSRIVRRKTTSPSLSTLNRIRTALIEVYNAPAERVTIEYLIACRRLTQSHETVQSDEGTTEVDFRLLKVDTWLRDKPEVVQDQFWDMLDTLMRTIDTASKS